MCSSSSWSPMQKSVREAKPLNAVDLDVRSRSPLLSSEVRPTRSAERTLASDCQSVYGLPGFSACTLRLSDYRLLSLHGRPCSPRTLRRRRRPAPRRVDGRRENSSHSCSSVIRGLAAARGQRSHTAEFVFT